MTCNRGFGHRERISHVLLANDLRAGSGNPARDLRTKGIPNSPISRYPAGEQLVSQQKDADAGALAYGNLIMTGGRQQTREGGSDDRAFGRNQVSSSALLASCSNISTSFHFATQQAVDSRRVLPSKDSIRARGDHGASCDANRFSRGYRP